MTATQQLRTRIAGRENKNKMKTYKVRWGKGKTATGKEVTTNGRDFTGKNAKRDARACAESTRKELKANGYRDLAATVKIEAE